MIDAIKFKRELELQRMNLTELSTRSGVAYAHLSNIKNGKVKNVKFETIKKIAHHLNDIPIHRLITDTILDLGRQDFLDSIGALVKEERLAYLDEALGRGLSPKSHLSRFPIAGHVHSNGKHSLPTEFGKDGVSKRSYTTIPFDLIDDPRAYGIVIQDVDLSPDIEPGTILLFSPEYPIQNLSLCLVRTEDGVWVRYVAMREDHCMLLTKSKVTDPIMLNLDGIDLMHRCVARYSAEKVADQVKT